MRIVRRQIAHARRVRRGEVDLAAAFDVVAPAIRDATVAASIELTRLGIPHALAGGLAVGAHGYPRATKVVDFLVGDEAFEHHGPIVTLRAPFQVGGVPVDSVPIPPDGPFLARELEHPAMSVGVPVISVEALVFMKLLAGRKRDLADVTELVKGGMDVDKVRAYLSANAPERAGEFDEIAREAEAEAP